MNEDMKICMHCLVSGRVQGVFFRANTKSEAEKLGLTGWVRNLSDGKVEVLACGEPAKVERLLVWLQHGPERAQVADFSSEEVPWQDYQEFKII